MATWPCYWARPDGRARPRHRIGRPSKASGSWRPPIPKEGKLPPPGPELQQPELPAEQDRRGEGPAVLPGGRRHPGKAGGRRPRQRGLAERLGAEPQQPRRLESRAGRAAAAEAAYRRAIDIQRQLVRRAPAVLQYRRDLAISYNNLGRLCSQGHDFDKAQAMFQEACTILEELVRDDPAELNYHSDLGGTLNNLAKAMEQTGRTDEALTAYAESIRHQCFALERAPQVARFREFLAQQYDNYARLLRSRHRVAEAEAALAAGNKLRAARGADCQSAARGAGCQPAVPRTP